MQTPDYPTPPRWPLAILRLFIRDQYLEEIEGDLEEVFLEYLEEYPERRARRLYTLEVIRLLRPNLIKKILSPSHHIHLDMFKHNILLAARHYWRHKTSFVINLLGLSTGLACFLLISLWVQDELKTDRFHVHQEELYQVLEHTTLPNGIHTKTNNSGLTGPALAAEMPEVLAAVTARTKSINAQTLSIGETNLKAQGLYASADFFRLFSFPIKEGTRQQALVDVGNIAISESLAMRLFGRTEQVVGESIEWEHHTSFLVAAVFEDPPKTSSLQFDYVLPFKVWSQDNRWVDEWRNTHPQTFLLLEEGTDVEAFNEKIANYIAVKTENNETKRRLAISKYADAYLYGDYENGIQQGGRIEYVWLFSLIALFILLIACINFMNLSTARASLRSREIGVKKALGAGRRSLVAQFLSESLFLSFGGLVVALLIVVFFLPTFSEMTGKSLALVWDGSLIAWLLACLLFTGLLAGSYPALYLSMLKPILIVKGKIHTHWGELWVRKGLVVLQFSLSIMLIVAVWVVYQQVRFTQEQHLGYQRDNVIMIEKEGEMDNPANASVFLEELQKIPGIIDASSIDNTMTESDWGTNSVQWPGKDPEDRTSFEIIQVDYGMMELLEMEMEQGRSFSQSFGSDTTGLIFNETAIRHMGLENPVGMRLDMGGTNWQIIGVVKDFHFESFHEQVKPLLMYQGNRGRYLMAKIDGQRTAATIEAMRTLYKKSNPGFVLDYSFVDENYEALYAAEDRVARLSQYFAALATLISCLGLFGLAMFTAAKRKKEIGLRKVLGANSYQLLRLLSDDFTKMVLIALLIGLPTSYILVQMWLETFAFHIDLQWYIFLGAGCAALLIAWVTVAVQLGQTLRLNPIESLREE